MESDKDKKGIATAIYVLIVIAILSGCAMTINVITRSNDVSVESSQNGEMKNDSIHIKTNVK